MNQGRIWCVVHPTVGLPLLLGSVAITSLIVHACIMTHTDWMSSYWEGGRKTATSDATPPNASVVKTDAGLTMTVTPVAATPGAPASFVITVAPPVATPAIAPQARPVDAGVIHAASAN